MKECMTDKERAEWIRLAEIEHEVNRLMAEQAKPRMWLRLYIANHDPGDEDRS